MIQRVAIIGDGVAARCCAHILSRTGFRVALRRIDRPRVPTIMIGDAAAALIRDVFGRPSLFEEAARITGRAVAWGNGAESNQIPHSAVVLSEEALLDRLDLPGVSDSLAGLTPDLTIYASAGGPSPATHHFFGSQRAATARVSLTGARPATAYIESLDRGWLFLVPAVSSSAWLLAIGGGASESIESQLAQSRVIRPLITSVETSAGAFSACPRVAMPLYGPDWLACGGTALSFDPICGDGAAQAVRGAILASAVIRAIAKGGDRESLMKHYETRLLAGMQRHLALCADFYRVEESAHGGKRNCNLLRMVSRGVPRNWQMRPNLVTCYGISTWSREPLQWTKMAPSGSIAEWKTYARIATFLRPYTKQLILVLLVSLFSTALSLVQPYLSKLLIDQALLRRDMHALVWIAAIMLAATVLDYGINILASYRYVKISAAMLFDMRVALFRHLHTLSPRFYARFRLGDLMSRLNSDVGEVQRVSADSLLSILSNVLFFVGCVAMMLWLNWKLFLVSVVLVPACVMTFLHFQRKLTALTKQLRERSADLGSLFVDTILGMRVVVSMGAGEHEAGRFRERNDAFVLTMLRVQIASFMTSALPGTILTVATSAVVLYGGWQIMREEMSVGTLVAFMAYHMRLLSPIQTLMGMTSGLASARVSLARIFEIFDTPAEISERPGALPLAGVRDSIRFENVSLNYGRNPVLNNVNIEIPAGIFCAILGSSGAGKSTLADLLVRYLDPDEGRILIDARDVRDLALEGLRREIMLVDQSPYLFNTTIAGNIAFAMPGANRGDIEAAARAAGLDELLQRLPEGFNTNAGERGLALSAGERQRIALARALLRRPSVLILDEPTSALDAETEKIVASGLREALPTSTLIVITHREALAEIADAVVTIEGGRAQFTYGVPSRSPSRNHR